jgi:hypothetical protein
MIPARTTTQESRQARVAGEAYVSWTLRARKIGENIMDKAYALFKRKLEALQKTIISQLKTCKDSYYREDMGDKIQQTKQLQAIAVQLKDICLDDSPGWLSQILYYCDKILTNQSNYELKRDFGSSIGPIVEDVTRHEWEIGGINTDFDFEGIYAKYKAESKLNVLFSELVSLIEKIIGEDNIELVEAQKELKRLLTIIRTNINKSMSSDEAILSYLLYFIKEFLVGLASRIPVLGEFVDALFKTAKKIDEEMQLVREKTQEDVAKRTSVPKAYLYDNTGKIKELDDIFSTRLSANY